MRRRELLASSAVLMSGCSTSDSKSTTQTETENTTATDTPVETEPETPTSTPFEYTEMECYLRMEAEATTLSDVQQRNIDPIVYSELDSSHQRIIDDILNSDYQCYPTQSTTAQEVMNMARDKMQNQPVGNTSDDTSRDTAYLDYPYILKEKSYYSLSIDYGDQVISPQ